MKLIDLFERKHLFQHGLTEISREGKFIVITHGGNMGDTEKNSVKPNVDKILGSGAFDFLRQHGHIYKDKIGNVHSDPSYSYVLIVPIEYYREWQNRNVIGESRTFKTVPKARNKQLHDTLMAKKGGSHYSEKHDYKRAKEKQKFQKQMQDME